MLSLGIAANVAVFSLVNGLFLRPFAFPGTGPARLYQRDRAEVEPRDCRGINYPDFHTWREAREALRRDCTLGRPGPSISSTSTWRRAHRGRALVTHDLGRKTDGIPADPGPRVSSPEEDRAEGDRRSCSLPRRCGAGASAAARTCSVRTLKLDGVSLGPSSAWLPPEADSPWPTRSVWVPLAGRPREEGSELFLNYGSGAHEGGCDD